ncbi:MAG: 60S ribosomal export protein NMD3 [Candidatus Diapherotrites archaeon]
MPLERMCPKCGTNKGHFIGSFCTDCYLKDHDLVQIPEKIEIEHCKVCNKIRYRGKWQEQTPELIENLVKSNIKTKEMGSERISIDLEPMDDNTTIATVVLTGLVQNQEVTIEKETHLVPKEVMCDPCMRVQSYYHEAILQIRFKDEKPTAIKNEKIKKEIQQLLFFEKKRDPLSEAIAIKEAKNGLDFFIGSKKAARKISSILASKYKSDQTVSYKTTGRDKFGKDKKRFTFCIRI